MLDKIIQIKVSGSYLTLSDDKQYPTIPRNVGIIKCVMSKEHPCFSNKTVYTLFQLPRMPSTVLHDQSATKSLYSILIRIFQSYARQVSPNYWQTAIVHKYTIEHRCPRDMDTGDLNPHTVLIPKLQECTICISAFI